MGLESMSFLAYLEARLPADPTASDDVLLIKQGDTVRRIELGDLAQELAAESGGGAPATVIAETTLTALHGQLFVKPEEAATVLLHLPVYAAVSDRKVYRIKNLGPGAVLVAADDGKLIDEEPSLGLAPGDRCQLVKDGENWQTV